MCFIFQTNLILFWDLEEHRRRRQCRRRNTSSNPQPNEERGVLLAKTVGSIKTPWEMWAVQKNDLVSLGDVNLQSKSIVGGWGGWGGVAKNKENIKMCQSWKKKLSSFFFRNIPIKVSSSPSAPAFNAASKSTSTSCDAVITFVLGAAASTSTPSATTDPLRQIRRWWTNCWLRRR